VSAVAGDALRMAIYGDSRGGDGPHRVIARQIVASRPQVVLHSGDAVQTAGDAAGWRRHLAATLELGRRAPLVLALGNHEIHPHRGATARDGLLETLRHAPPPDDPVARRHGTPPMTYHVRVGPALIVALDSNAPLGPGSPQHAFLDEVLAARGARRAFVVMHHGASSSGPHGPHRDAVAVRALLSRHRVTAAFAGHDHIYERAHRDGVAYVVSGGGGAPLYPRRTADPATAAFSATYNWVRVDLTAAEVRLRAYSLEGALLDTADLAVAPPPSRQLPPRGRAWMAGGTALVVGALAWVMVRMLAARSGTG
jgi:acid phosphatase type 7